MMILDHLVTMVVVFGKGWCVMSRDFDNDRVALIMRVLEDRMDALYRAGDIKSGNLLQDVWAELVWESELPWEDE